MSKEKHRLEMIVLVKAAPVLTSKLDETMCVAGIEFEGDVARWVRLHPVPFRDLADRQKFKKYQRISVDVIAPKSDRRPETWTPVENTVVTHETTSSANGWQRRRELVGQLPEVNMCDLVTANQAGSGPAVPSLGVVRPASKPTLLISKRDAEQVARWRERAVAAAGRASLFDDPDQEKQPFEVVEWRFRYGYKCRAPGCGGHEQTIVDWEVVALWSKVRYQQDWRDAMRAKFEDELWDGRDSLLFVGNQEEYPNAFLVLGIFWPPDGPVQETLLPL